MRFLFFFFIHFCARTDGLNQKRFSYSTSFCFLLYFSFKKIMGRRKQLRLKWNCDFCVTLIFGSLVRCVHLLFFFVCVSAQCVDVATNSGGLSESGRRCCQLHRGGQCGSPGLRSRCSCPTFNNGRLRCRPRKVSFPLKWFPHSIRLFCNIYFSKPNSVTEPIRIWGTASDRCPRTELAIPPNCNPSTNWYVKTKKLNRKLFDLIHFGFLGLSPQAAMYRSSYNRFTPYWENLPEVNDVGEEKKQKKKGGRDITNWVKNQTRPAAVFFLFNCWVFWCVCVSVWPVVVSLPFVRSSHTKNHQRAQKTNQKITSPETHKNFSHVVTHGGAGPKYFNFLLF